MMRRWNTAHLQALIDTLKGEGWRVLGPGIRDHAVTYAEIDELPVGWGDEQEAGRYRLHPRGDQSRFGYNLGPSTWKQFLFPPSETIFRYRNGEFVSERSQPQPMAFIGVRACELAAIQVQDRVFDGAIPEPGYRQRREAVLLIAVNCSQAAATCFCDSTGDGPAVGDGADMTLTEVNPDNPFYLVQAHSERTQKLLQSIGSEPASEADIQQGTAAVEQARQQMSRRLPQDMLGEALLDQLDNPHWDEVSARCLACGNCTQVCPTCFCSTTREQVDPLSSDVTHVRLWDSCFTEGHSYINGGVVHKTVRSRYRQWLTHKLGSWPVQFGVSGCTGCGRCVSWCPVGIDITEEVKKLGPS